MWNAASSHFSLYIVPVLLDCGWSWEQKRAQCILTLCECLLGFITKETIMFHTIQIMTLPMLQTLSFFSNLSTLQSHHLLASKREGFLEMPFLQCLSLNLKFSSIGKLFLRLTFLNQMQVTALMHPCYAKPHKWKVLTGILWGCQDSWYPCCEVPLSAVIQLRSMVGDMADMYLPVTLGPWVGHLTLSHMPTTESHATKIASIFAIDRWDIYFIPWGIFWKRTLF